MCHASCLHHRHLLRWQLGYATLLRESDRVRGDDHKKLPFLYSLAGYRVRTRCTLEKHQYCCVPVMAGRTGTRGRTRWFESDRVERAIWSCWVWAFDEVHKKFSFEDYRMNTRGPVIKFYSSLSFLTFRIRNNKIIKAYRLSAARQYHCGRMKTLVDGELASRTNYH